MKIPDRYNRQLGLVNQSQVANVNVLISGCNPILPYLIANLAFLGIGTSNGGIFFLDDGSSVKEETVKGQAILSSHDIGTSVFEASERAIKKINSDVNVFKVQDPNSMPFDAVIALPCSAESPILPETGRIIWGQIGNLSIYMGTKKCVMPRLSHNVLTPSLSSICAGLISQEVLRITDCIRPTDIVKSWVTVNYLFRKEQQISFKKAINGESLKSYLEKPVSSDDDSVIFRVELPKGSGIPEMLQNSIDVIEQSPVEYRRPTCNLFYSPIPGCRIINGVVHEPDVKIPESIPSSKIFLVGIGGLGSWLASVYAGVAQSGSEIIIVDEDLEVEPHNLNRQILFTEADIGSPKAIAAEKRLREINPNITIKSYVGALSLDTIRCFVKKEYMSHEKFTKQWGVSIPGNDDPFNRMCRIADLNKVLAHEAKNASVIVSCLDSLFAKYLSSALATLGHTPIVNAGAQNFEGNVDLIPADAGCLLCWHGESLKYRQEKVSCGELEAATSSIVTTTSIVAGIEASLLISHLAQIGKVEHYVHYRGKLNALSCCTSADSFCQIHSKKEHCPSHLNWRKKQNDTQEQEQEYNFF